MRGQESGRIGSCTAQRGLWGKEQDQKSAEIWEAHPGNPSLFIHRPLFAGATNADCATRHNLGATRTKLCTRRQQRHTASLLQGEYKCKFGAFQPPEATCVVAKTSAKFPAENRGGWVVWAAAGATKTGGNPSVEQTKKLKRLPAFRRKAHAMLCRPRPTTHDAPN